MASSVSTILNGVAGLTDYPWLASNFPVGSEGCAVKVNGTNATWTAITNSDNQVIVRITAPAITNGARIELICPATSSGSGQTVSSEIVLSTANAAGNITAQTSATGATYVAFPSVNADNLTISNDTGTPIEVQQDGAGSALSIPTASIYKFKGISNANQLAVRRVDLTSTQVTVKARWER